MFSLRPFSVTTRRCFLAAWFSSVTLPRASVTTRSPAPGACAGGQHLQAHHGAVLAADQLHHVLEPPADDLGERATGALADAEDPVVDLQRAGRAAAGPPAIRLPMVT